MKDSFFSPPFTPHLYPCSTKQCLMVLEVSQFILANPKSINLTLNLDFNDFTSSEAHLMNGLFSDPYIWVGRSV